MSTIERSIEVEALLGIVYKQWTQFEEFPRFMDGVREVRQLDDRRLLWRSEIGGQAKEWEAEMLQLDYTPEGVLEKARDAVEIVSSRVGGPLERFKEFIESRGAETGAGRGQIPRPRD